MSLIPKHHWALTKNAYKAGLLAGVYNNDFSKNLYIKSIELTYENLEPLMDKLSTLWGWKDQGRYNEQALREKLAKDGTALYLLCDSTKKNPVIGYSLVSSAPRSLKERFWSAANDTRVLEIDNLGLFPGHEGGGRGKAYFEMIFARYFKTNDIVYWSQHDTHAPTLTRFYRDKMQMTHLATDYVQDFRQKQPEVA